MNGGVGGVRRPITAEACNCTYLDFSLLSESTWSIISKKYNSVMMQWIKALKAIPIANTGSVARDHLANERTFLAWTRTGLGFIALGVAIERFDALEALTPSLKSPEQAHLRTPAIFLVGAGSGCLVHGTLRYFSVLHLLQRGLFRPNILGVALIVLTSTGFADGGTALVTSK